MLICGRQCFAASDSGLILPPAPSECATVAVSVEVPKCMNISAPAKKFQRPLNHIKTV